MSQHTKKEPTNREILAIMQDSFQKQGQAILNQIHQEIQELSQKVDERFDAAFEIFATKQDLSDAVSQLVTKDEFNDFKDNTYDRLDFVTKHIKRLDEEDTAHLAWLKRHDKALEQFLG